jgi:polyhydroxyalkanoate synthesis regulator phasin
MEKKYEKIVSLLAAIADEKDAKRQAAASYRESIKTLEAQVEALRKEIADGDCA